MRTPSGKTRPTEFPTLVEQYFCDCLRTQRNALLLSTLISMNP